MSRDFKKDKCENGIEIPKLTEDICEGCKTNSKCVFDEDIFPELELERPSQYELNRAFYISLQQMKTDLEELKNSLNL